MAAEATFRVLIPGEAAAADVLGLWDAAPGDEPGTVWEVDVGAGPTDGAAALQEPARQLDAVERALPDAERRLQAFVYASRSPQLAFAAPGAGRGAAERRLALAMAPETQAFALGGLRGDLDDAVRRAGEFASQVRHTFGQPALVRSSAAGRPLGRTRVSWGGDVQTVWAAGRGGADAAVHEQAVRLALATFQSWLRIVTLVGAGAVQLSLLLPTGIGALTALPAAWNFITDILSEYQRLRALPT